MKICSLCAVEITLKNRILKRSICRDCKNKETRQWKANNPEYVRKNQRQWKQSNKDHVREYRRIQKEEKIQIVLKAKQGPCADCGKAWPPVAMDFDHVQGEKKYSISVLMVAPYSPTVLVEELKKCDLVCACCHRIRTARRGKWDSRLCELQSSR